MLFQMVFTMAAAGRDVIPVDETAGLNQALVLQCSLVTLRDSPKKNHEEEQKKKFLAEEHKTGCPGW